MTDDLKAQTAALISYLEAHHGIGVDVVKEQAQQIATLTQERDIAVRDLRIEKDMGRPWKQELDALRERAEAAEGRVSDLSANNLSQ